MHTLFGRSNSCKPMSYFRLLCYTIILVLAIFSVASVCAAAQNKIPSEIWNKTKAGGTVTVWVQLRLPLNLQKPTKDNLSERRIVIASLQRDILTELKGSNYELRTQLKNVPLLSLIAGEESLRILGHSDLVVGVTEGGTNYVLP